MGSHWRWGLLNLVAALLIAGLLAEGAVGGRGASSPLPNTERQRILALFGSTYLPSWIPPGFVYVQWKSKPGSASVYGNFLEVDFANHGSLLEWVVGDSRDPDYYGNDACSRHPFNARVYVQNGRRVVFQAGNHGDTATLCLHGTAIYVWNDHRVTPATMAKVVARARLAG